MRRLAGFLIVAIVFTLLGLLLGRTEVGSQVAQTARSGFDAARSATLDRVLDSGFLDARMAVLLENPELMEVISERGGFGGDFSRAAAQNMFGRDAEAIADVRKMTRVVPYGERSWHIIMPIVNAVLFETDEGLVLVDTGMVPAGPALLDAIRSVSDKPLHTIIYTHGHVDHAYGTWALIEAGETPQIIAQENIMPRFERYVLMPGSFAKYMSQPVFQLPASLDDIVLPTRLFKDRLELEIGGEIFVLQHHKGETDDQLYVWVPGRKILATADYYQGFLPNAGNGKRAQRHVREWIVALREMAGLDAETVLPAHGEAMTDPGQIDRELNLLAEAFESIWDQTIAGLREGIRKDLISERVKLPQHLATEHSLREQYVSAQDVSKMIIKRYTGWWDDMASNWSPASAESRAAMVMELAGGATGIDARARELMKNDIRLASHLAEWAWLAEPGDPLVQQLVIDVFKARILDADTLTQEGLAYLDIMAAARARQQRNS